MGKTSRRRRRSNVLFCFAKIGIGKTRTRITRRRRNRKQKNENRGVVVDVPWSDLNHDVLFLVMMRLGVVEIFAFSGVCKSWRSLAVSNKNKFIVSRPPMSIHVSDYAHYPEECYFKDFEGRKFKPIIPHYAGRMCIGVASGYLILLGAKNKDLWLVNLITRHELYFPHVPRKFFCCPGDVRVILVFSPSISGWVVVMLNFCTRTIWFSAEGTQKWIFVPTRFSIRDLLAFKGKIYSIHSEDKVWLCEIRLYPKPESVLLEKHRISEDPGIFSCGENLYAMNGPRANPYETIHELDFGNMKWVSCENKGKEYAFFFSNLTRRRRVVIVPKSRVDLRSQYGRYDVVPCKHRKPKLFHAHLWYFFHDCLNVNLID